MAQTPAVEQHAATATDGQDMLSEVADERMLQASTNLGSEAPVLVPVMPEQAASAATMNDMPMSSGTSTTVVLESAQDAENAGQDRETQQALWDSWQPSWRSLLVVPTYFSRFSGMVAS
eukprot:1298730-Amphidinium_carterae.3